MRQGGRWHAALLASLSRVQMSWLCSASFATWLYSSHRVDGLGVCLSTTAIFCGHWLTSHGLTTAWDPDLKPDTSWTALPSENRSCWAANPRCSTSPQVYGNDPIRLWQAVTPVYIILLLTLHPAGGHQQRRCRTSPAVAGRTPVQSRPRHRIGPPHERGAPWQPNAAAPPQPTPPATSTPPRWPPSCTSRPRPWPAGPRRASYRT
jgi:hypothetical protein